jgi:trk system potassium uptake protein TrkA
MASFLVIGLGRFGSAVAFELQALRQEVLGVDVAMETVQECAETLPHVVQLDATDLDALRSLDIPQFDACLVSRGSSLEDSVVILMHLKDLGAKRVVVKALTEMQARVFQLLGADEIVYPERDMGIHVARLLVEPEVLNFIPLGDSHRVEHVIVLDRRHGTRVRDVERDPQVHLLLLRRGHDVRLHPSCDIELREGDELVVVGPNALLDRLHEQNPRRP